LSEDQKFGEAGVESDAGYTAMPESLTAPPEEDKKTYEGDTATA
jgi:hypothetical protein